MPHVQDLPRAGHDADCSGENQMHIPPQDDFDAPKNFRWTRNLLSFSPLVLAIAFCQAQTRVPTIREDLQFQNLSVQLGPAGLNVFSIHQDPAGFLWFGTEKGAIRFDGVDVRTIVLGITSWFLTDTQGKLWIGADGLTCIDRSRDSLKTYFPTPGDTNSHLSRHVTGIVEEPDGTFWIGHYGGLERFDPRTGRFTHIPEPALPFITSLARDKRGRLWIGTRNGVVRFDPTSLEVVRIPLTREAPGSISRSDRTAQYGSPATLFSACTPSILHL